MREFCGEEARECRRRPDFIGDFAGCISGRPINRMLAAVRRARELDSITKGEKLPKARTTRMYRLIEALALAGHKQWLTGEWLQLREELESGRPG